MRILCKVFYKVKKIISSKHRKEKKGSIDDDISIISCNCIAGLLYHDYHKKFMSPTINLYIDSPDFVKFVRKLDYYIDKDLVEVKGCKYPIGKLDDVKIHFLHYKTFEDAKIKWEERKKRINYDKIFVIMSDRDFFSEDLIEEFKKIKYKKILYSHKKIDIEECVYIKKDKDKKMVDDLTKYINFKGDKVYEYYFDFEKWFTGKYGVKECLKND